MKQYGSQYLDWVTTHKPPRYNLASSGILPCSLDDLRDESGDIGNIEINGSGFYGHVPLLEAIARHCGVPVDCVVGASGTSMANFLVMAALVEPGDEVLIEYPAYEPLLAAARFLGAEIKRFPRDGHLHQSVSKHTRLIVITNLHNPTCHGIDQQELVELREKTRWAGARVLIDEVYLECLYERASSAFHLGTEFVSTASLTKAYGLGGLRCGWILADPDFARRIRRLKDVVDPGAPHAAELLSVAAFRKLNHLAARAQQILANNRALLLEFLRTTPDVEVTLPQYGTCVFPRLKKPEPDAFFNTLHDRFDTSVVPGRFFETPDHFRLGIGGDSEILAEGLDRLRRALEQM